MREKENNGGWEYVGLEGKEGKEPARAQMELKVLASLSRIWTFFSKASY